MTASHRLVSRRRSRAQRGTWRGNSRRRGREPEQDGEFYDDSNLVGGDCCSDTCAIEAAVPLAQMFNYSTDLRSATQGKGEFTMEYLKHEAVTRDEASRLTRAYDQQVKDARGK